jgi:hypothetical protein
LVALRFYRDTSGKEQYLLAQRQARASEALSGTRRGDCETATTKRVKTPKRYQLKRDRADYLAKG